MNSLTYSRHRFAVIGLSVLSLAMLAGCAGVDDSDAQTTGKNKTPEAHLTVDQTSDVWTGESLSFSAEGSEDEDGEIVSYRFDFGDGTPAVTTGSDEPEVTHAYAQGGEYIVTLTVTDNGNDRTGGLTDTAALEVVVNEEVPIAQFVVARDPTGGNQTTERGSPFPAYEDADRFEVELEIAGNPLVTGSSEIEIKVEEPDGDNVVGASETVTISGTETKDVDLDGLLMDVGTHKVVVTAKSGAATVSGTVKVYYGSEDLQDN